jgi:predicted DNA-binding transcriptional regulator AlpA
MERPRQPRRVVRRNKLHEYIGLRRTQLDKMINSGDFPSLFPLREGGRAKGIYEDVVALWQTWRQARLEGKTNLSWREWEKRHAERDGGSP